MDDTAASYRALICLLNGQQVCRGVYSASMNVIMQDDVAPINKVVPYRASGVTST